MYLYNYEKLEAALHSGELEALLNKYYSGKGEKIELLNRFTSDENPLRLRKTPTELIDWMYSDLHSMVKERRDLAIREYREKWSDFVNLCQLKLVELANKAGFEADRYSDGDVKIRETDFLDFSYYTPLDYERNKKESIPIFIKFRFRMRSNIYPENYKNITDFNQAVTSHYQSFLSEKEIWMNVIRDHDQFVQNELNQRQLTWGK